MRFLLGLLIGLVATVGAVLAQEVPPRDADADAPYIVMVEQPGCYHCARWHEEIGPAYPKTELGAALGLTSVQLQQVRQQPFQTSRAVSFTPTFLLIVEGKEAGRLEGYAGAHFFWPLLEGMVDKARIAKDG